MGGFPTSFTDYQRILTELLDLPFKPGYGRDFLIQRKFIEGKSLSPEDLLRPRILIKLGERKHLLQLILEGYPNRIDGYFINPPLHPHIFSNGRICWDVERNWKSGMTIYEDYLMPLIRMLKGGNAR